MFNEMFGIKKEKGKKIEAEHLIDNLIDNLWLKIPENLKEDLRKHRKFVEDQILRPFVKEIQKLEFYDPEEARKILERILNEAEKEVNIQPQEQQPQEQQPPTPEGKQKSEAPEKRRLKKNFRKNLGEAFSQKIRVKKEQESIIRAVDRVIDPIKEKILKQIQGIQPLLEPILKDISQIEQRLKELRQIDLNKIEPNQKSSIESELKKKEEEYTELKQTVEGLIKEKKRLNRLLDIVEKIKKDLITFLSSMEEFDENEIVDYLENRLNQVQDPNLRHLRQQLEEAFFEQPEQAKEEAKIPPELFQSIIKIYFAEKKEQIIENGEEKEVTNVILNEELDKTLEVFFRKEGKGKNFREKADPEFLRGYLYLILPEGELKNKFKTDFERLMSSKEIFWLYFLLPFLEKKFKLKKGFEPGEFPRELINRLEDLSKGKNRITLWFTQEDLPDDIKNELNKFQNEDERNKFLESLGIHQVGNKYEIYITQDKLAEIIGRYTETLGNLLISEARVQKQINDIQKKLKEAKPLLGNYYGAYNILFAGLLEGIKGLRTRGGAEEEWKKIEEQLNKFSQDLDPIVQEKDKTKAQSKALNFFKGAGGFLKEAGFWAGMTAGIFGLMLFWFLPLWLIVKMNKELEKFIGGK